MGTLAWELWLGNFSLRTSAWELWLRILGLRSQVEDVRLAEPGSSGFWGNPLQDTGGTRPGGSNQLVLKDVQYEPSR